MDDLSAEAVLASITTRRLGRPTLFYLRVPSTNDTAHEQARAGAPDGTLVLADEQTAGRGRLGRSWWAPAGSCLLMSLILRPPLPLVRAGQLTMCLGLGAAQAIEEVAGIEPALKWPNDLVIDGRKLGGMLSEAESEAGQLTYAVLGLGLNVNVSFAEGAVPLDVAENAASLLQHSGKRVERVALLSAILEHTEALYERILRGESLHEAWSARLDTLGKRVRVTTQAGMLEGMAAGVTVEGGLILRNGATEETVIWSGDVATLRRL